MVCKEKPHTCVQGRKRDVISIFFLYVSQQKANFISGLRQWEERLIQGSLLNIKPFCWGGEETDAIRALQKYKDSALLNTSLWGAVLPRLLNSPKHPDYSSCQTWSRAPCAVHIQCVSWRAQHCSTVCKKFSSCAWKHMHLKSSSERYQLKRPTQGHL